MHSETIKGRITETGKTMDVVVLNKRPEVIQVGLGSGVHSVCGSISSTSTRAGSRSSSGSMAPEWMIPTPSAGRSAEAAEADDTEFFVHGEMVELAQELDVETRATGSASESPEHGRDRPGQLVDVAQDGRGHRHADAVPRNRPSWAHLKRSGRERLRVQLDLGIEAKLALEPEVQHVAAGRALRMAEPLG